MLPLIPFKFVRFLYIGMVASVLLLSVYGQISWLYNGFVYSMLLVFGLVVSVLYALSVTKLIIAVNKLCYRPFKQFLKKTWGIGTVLLSLVVVSYFTAGIPYLSLSFTYLIINGIGFLVAYGANPTLDKLQFLQCIVYMVDIVETYKIHARYIVGVQNCRKYHDKP